MLVNVEKVRMFLLHMNTLFINMHFSVLCISPGDDKKKKKEKLFCSTESSISKRKYSLSKQIGENEKQKEGNCHVFAHSSICLSVFLSICPSVYFRSLYLCVCGWVCVSIMHACI